MSTILSCIPHQAGLAQTSDLMRQGVVDEVLAPWTAGRTPGCAIGVSVDGRVVHERGAGLADLTNDVPITPQTVFHAASVAKQFTAFAIGLLEQRGSLSSADPVRRFIPELPEPMAAITIEQLIHHTDGLREQGQLLYLAGWRSDDVLTEHDILWALTRQRALNFAPGTEVVYGNAAYNLLAVVVQRVTGTTLQEFAAKEIFAPLGMSLTRFSDGYREVVGHRASSYVRGQDGAWSYAPLNIRYTGSTGLLTTVGDLLKWEQNLLDGRIGGSRLARAMRTSGTLRDGTPIAYGHGLRLRDYRGLPSVGHDGVDAGYRSEALLFPDQRIAIVALCNASTADAGRIARRIADGYLADQVMRPEFAPVTRMAPEEQALLAGTYWSEQTDETIRLRWNGSALRIDGANANLVPIGGGAFRPEDQPHEWRFGRTPAGIQTISIRDSWPTRRGFVRVATPPASDSAMAAMTGRYYSIETDMNYLVRLVDGGLRLSWPRENDIALTPAGGNRFSGSVGTVTFASQGDGRYTGLTISNRRLRRLAAVRSDDGRAPDGDAAVQRARAANPARPAIGMQPASRGADPLPRVEQNMRQDVSVVSDPPGVAAPIGPYSHMAVVPAHAQLLFLAGQVGARPDGVIETNVDAQYAQALRNIVTLLRSRGADPGHLVKITIFLKKPLDLERALDSRRAAFGDAVPPASLVYVDRLARPDLLVEVEAIAAIVPTLH